MGILPTLLGVVETGDNSIRKQESATSDRDPKVAENEQRMSHCVNCGQVQGDKCKLKRCSGCETMKYWSKKCQQAHWKDHKSICCAIKELLRQNRESMKRDSDAERVNYVSHLTPKQRAKVTRLIGNKCLISCILSGKRANALLTLGTN